MGTKEIPQVTRPTRLIIDEKSLLHNVKLIQTLAPTQKIIAMVKANAYGCGVNKIVPILAKEVSAFGVACMEEALLVCKYAKHVPCILFQGVFSEAELRLAYQYKLHLVIHQKQQLDWLLQNPAEHEVNVWVKVNTGMHRLGFLEQEVSQVMQSLVRCSWVKKPIGMMTHLACADEFNSKFNEVQLKKFSEITRPYNNILRSIANSAAILAHPQAYADVIRPGVMLYGVSPFADRSSQKCDLLPVMRFVSKVTEIHDYPANIAVGYGGAWKSTKPSRIGVVPVGYADGYPRCINSNAKVWIAGNIVPIVGRISMDMLTIDLTSCKKVSIGADVELWGQHISVDEVASAAGAIGHEIIARIGSRVIRV